MLNMQTPNRHLRVFFYNPANDPDGYFNHVVAKCDGPYCHVEVQFECDTACSIYMGTAVVFKKRNFSNPNYTCKHLYCADKDYKKAFEFARQEFIAKKQFSVYQLMNAFTKVRSHTGDECTFCSKLCSEILKLAKCIPETTNSCHQTPTSLSRILDGSVPTAKTVPVTLKKNQKQTSPAIQFK